MREDYCLSINHMFFNQKINKKIELGKNIKIKFNFMESLSSTDIINLITKRESEEKIKEDR